LQPVVVLGRLASPEKIQKALQLLLSRQIEKDPSVGDLVLGLEHKLLIESIANTAQNIETVDAKSWISILLAAAALVEKRARPPEQAVRLYRLVLELDPQHREAVFGLGVLLFDLKRPHSLIELYRERIRITDNIGEKVSLHLYVAEALENQLSDQDAAFMEIVHASRIDPHNLRIIDQLERLGRKANREQEVAVVLGEILLHASDARVRAGLALRLAELCLSAFDQPERALAYYRSALFDDGGDPEALKEIRDVFHQNHRFVELGRRLEEVSKDRRTSPHRNRMQRELVHVYQLDHADPQRALETLYQSVRQSPEDRKLLDDMSNFATNKDDYIIVAKAFEEVICRSQNPLLVQFARQRLGNIYRHTLGRPNDAMRVYEALLQDNPNHFDVLQCLGRLYMEYRSPEAAIALFRRILSFRPNDVRARKACRDLGKQLSESSVDQRHPAKRETSQ
jgi:tetratricopeptide (TPR) repeat protein